MNNGLAIKVQDLHKSFGDLHAVQGVTFDVQAGEIYSLLGPNGAGKSTTISMLSCHLQPNQGDAFVMGHSVLRQPPAVKASIGVVPQEIALHENISARDNLTFWGKMYGLRGSGLAERVDEVLDVIGLANRQKGRVTKFSGGMKRRLNIGIALLNKPDVLIMDEPTVGIDPQSRRNILDNVKELNRQGVTVLYTTHYMEEAQELSHQIAIMDQGQIIASGTHDELVKVVGELDRISLTLSVNSENLLDPWRRTEGVHQVSKAADPDDEIIDGHFLAMFVMILAQLVVLILFGQQFLKVGYFREPLATLLMLLATAFWSASLGLLIGIFARTEEQVTAFTIVLMLLLSGLGGAWMPLEFTGKTFQTAGHLLPTAWAIDGFENLVVRGLGLNSVLLPAAIVFGFAITSFATAIWRFRFE